MKTIIVCGLLGAGKTTFVRHFVDHSPVKTVVLVNDFGQAGIDGEIISASGVETIELPSGCVCCTLKSDLLSTLRLIEARMAPQLLVIEPSGIASPSSVIEALACLNIEPATVVGIVDATEFVELYEAEMYGRFFEDQVTISDVVLVNKTDLAGPGKTEAAVNLVERLNPRAVVYRTVDAKVPGPLPEPATGPRAAATQAPHLLFSTLSLPLRATLAFDSAQEVFAGLASGNYGRIVRAKALMNTDRGPFRFDLASSQVSVAPFEHQVESGRLVVIGEEIMREQLASALGIKTFLKT